MTASTNAELARMLVQYLGSAPSRKLFVAAGVE
jgi:hypothetical protein